MSVDLTHVVIPTSSSPIMGAPSPAFEDGPEPEAMYSIISSIFETCTSGEFSLAISCRNPFEISKRKAIGLEAKTITMSADEINITFNPSETALFASCFGPHKYCSKIYASSKIPGEKEVTLFNESLFHQVPAKTPITFKSVTNRFSIECSAITADDIKALILDSKYAEKFNKCSVEDQSKVIDGYLSKISLNIFKVNAVVMRILNDN